MRSAIAFLAVVVVLLVATVVSPDNLLPLKVVLLLVALVWLLLQPLDIDDLDDGGEE